MDRAILVVEDDFLHSRLYCAVLIAEGFRPVAIDDPRIAIEWAVTHNVVASVIDIRLPHVDGREVIRGLRGDGRTGHAPILAVSAVSAHDMEDSCLLAGADRYRAKPVSLKTLVQDVRDLVGSLGGGWR